MHFPVGISRIVASKQLLWQHSAPMRIGKLLWPVCNQLQIIAKNSNWVSSTKIFQWQRFVIATHLLNDQQFMIWISNSLDLVKTADDEMKSQYGDSGDSSKLLYNWSELSIRLSLGANKGTFSSTAEIWTFFWVDLCCQPEKWLSASHYQWGEFPLT